MSVVEAVNPEDIINLGKGHPNPTLLPLQNVLQAFEASSQAPNAPVTMMQYGRMQGPEKLCTLLSDWQRRASGRTERMPTPDNILVTNGAGPTLSLISHLFSNHGDLIFADSPGYFLSFYTFKDCRLTVVNIPTDTEGIDTDVVESLILQGKKPSLLYTVPMGNNPTGASMSEARKQKLIQLAQQHNFKILSDEVYQFLSFEKEFPKSLFEYDDPANPVVFSINSFSKLLGPGLRVGWVTTHAPLMNRLLDCGPLHSGGGLNPFTGTIVTQMIESGFVEKQVAKVCSHYKHTCNVLCDALDRYVCTAVREGEQVVYHRPTGGFFCFITLPDRIETAKLLDFSKKCGVSFFAGRDSSPGKDLFTSSMRLCFAFLEEDVIVEGVKRLGKAIQNY